VEWLIRHHLLFPLANEKTVLKWLKRLQEQGFKNAAEFEEALLQLFALHKADRLGGHTQPDVVGLEQVRKLAQSLVQVVPFFPAQLAISGRDIAAKLGSGPEVGAFLQNLLTRIQSGQLHNIPEDLFSALDARVRRLARKRQD
jgi:hypothetical protein